MGWGVEAATKKRDIDKTLVGKVCGFAPGDLRRRGHQKNRALVFRGRL